MCYYAFGYRDHRWTAAFHSVPVNITEKEDNYELSVYASSLVKEGFRITIKDDVLTIRYRAPNEEKMSETIYTRREYHPVSFERSFLLNNKVMIENLSAAYIEGVLKVILTKNPDTNKPEQHVQVA